ncbi:hypothetical protein FACS189445_2300 [Spirochaetia bacterium]|nr:hypothetical protein FACS189445_2300 [Spirochaetia bacterium]
MNPLPNEYFHLFEERVMKYLLFLVHAQQSIILPATDKIKIFDFAKKILRYVYSNIQRYQSNKNEFNLFDKNKVLITAFDEITKELEKDIRNYKRDITIQDTLFSYHIMIGTLTNTKFDVYLTPNEIKQMLSYRVFFNNNQNEKIQDRQSEDLAEKQDKEFAGLRKKTFQDMLHSNNNKNSMRFFEVNDYIIRKARKEDIKYSHDPGIPIKEGMYFIETQNEHIIKFKHEDRFIEYNFRVIDQNDSFIIYIQGHIKVNNQREEFYINEKYLNRQFKEVLNAYNLKRIIDLFNDLFMDNPGDDTDPKDTDSPNDIDDFLSGKIE